MSPLMPWTRSAAAAVAVCVVVVGGMGLRFHDHRTGSRLDLAIARHLAVLTDSRDGSRFVDACLRLTDPPLIVGVLVGMLAVAALAGRWRASALIVLTPLTALALTELVLKPLVHRTNIVPPGVRTLAYPSGHETAVSSVLVVLGLLVLRAGLGERTSGEAHHIGSPTQRLRPATRALAIVGLLGVFLLSAAGLVARSYHYASDTVGALGVCIATVLVLGRCIDAASAAFTRQRQSAREQAVS